MRSGHAARGSTGARDQAPDAGICSGRHPQRHGRGNYRRGCDIAHPAGLALRRIGSSESATVFTYGFRRRPSPPADRSWHAPLLERTRAFPRRGRQPPVQLERQFLAAPSRAYCGPGERVARWEQSGELAAVVDTTCAGQNSQSSGLSAPPLSMNGAAGVPFVVELVPSIGRVTRQRLP